jgi:hydrogenase-4 membrane subunit HyfE
MPPGTSDFYSAAAQIIPVLVLVVIVEQRDEKRRLSPLKNLTYVLITVGAAALGEMIALRDLYRGHAYLQDQYIVVGAMAFCGLALTIPIFVALQQEVEATGRRSSSVAGRVLAAIVAYAVLVFFVLVIRQH